MPQSLKLPVFLVGLTVVIQAASYDNTSYYVDYNPEDPMQYTLVMPEAEKIYVHKAGDLENIREITDLFQTFPQYSSGYLCFGLQNPTFAEDVDVDLLSDNCFSVPYFYIQADFEDSFYLYHTKTANLEYGIAGDATSFHEVQNSEEFGFDLNSGILSNQTAGSSSNYSVSSSSASSCLSAYYYAMNEAGDCVDLPNSCQTPPEGYVVMGIGVCSEYQSSSSDYSVSTSSSSSSIGPGDFCGGGVWMLYDCKSTCVSQDYLEDFIGNGVCNDGQALTSGAVNTNCSAFDFDGGDCPTVSSGASSSSCLDETAYYATNDAGECLDVAGDCGYISDGFTIRGVGSCSEYFSSLSSASHSCGYSSSCGGYDSTSSSSSSCGLMGLTGCCYDYPYGSDEYYQCMGIDTSSSSSSSESN